MKTDKVTFTQDFQGPESGNEFYAAGRKSKQRRGAELIALGVAVAGWGEVDAVTAQEAQAGKRKLPPDVEIVNGEKVLHGPDWRVMATIVHSIRPEFHIDPDEYPEDDFDWSQIKGVSTEISAALNYLDLTSTAKLLAWVTSGGDLTAIPGIGKARAAQIVEWAEDQL